MYTLIKSAFFAAFNKVTFADQILMIFVYAYYVKWNGINLLYT